MFYDNLMSTGSINVTSSRKLPNSLTDFTGIWIFRQKFIKPLSIKFHGNTTSGRQDFTYGLTNVGKDREKDGHYKGIRRFRNNVNTLKIFLFVSSLEVTMFCIH